MKNLHIITLLIISIFSLLLFSCQTEEVSIAIDNESTDLESYDIAIYNGIEYTMQEVLSDKELNEAYLNASAYHVKNRTIAFYDEAPNVNLDELIAKPNTETNMAAVGVIFYAEKDFQGRYLLEEFFYNDPHSNSTSHHKRNVPSSMNDATTSIAIIGQPSGGSSSSIRVKAYRNKNQSSKVFEQTITDGDEVYWVRDLPTSSDNKISSFKIEFANYGK